MLQNSHRQLCESHQYHLVFVRAILQLWGVSVGRTHLTQVILAAFIQSFLVLKLVQELRKSMSATVVNISIFHESLTIL
jgi:hypothetical protein